jgi:hypothetical protein
LKTGVLSGGSKFQEYLQRIKGLTFNISIIGSASAWEDKSKDINTAEAKMRRLLTALPLLLSFYFIPQISFAQSHDQYTKIIKTPLE